MPYLEGLPVPEHHVDYKEFWDGCKKCTLLIQRCSDCGWYRHYPRPVCPKCQSSDAKWHPVSGKGEIWSKTVITSPIHPAVEGKVPYNIVEIELIEQKGLRLTSNLVECSFEEIFIGMPVEVVFEQMSSELTLARFRRSSFK